MIPLLCEPKVEVGARDCTLVLFVCDCFDEGYSFRGLFAKFATVLRASREFTLSLPPETPAEDFVDGSMRWGSTTYDVYFERSLGFVTFSSPSQSTTRELLAAMTPELTWPPAHEPSPGASLEAAAADQSKPWWRFW